MKLPFSVTSLCSLLALGFVLTYSPCYFSRDGEKKPELNGLWGWRQRERKAEMKRGCSKRDKRSWGRKIVHIPDVVGI